MQTCTHLHTDREIGERKPGISLSRQRAKPASGRGRRSCGGSERRRRRRRRSKCGRSLRRSSALKEQNARSGEYEWEDVWRQSPRTGKVEK